MSLMALVISLYILMLMIYKGEYVYYINGGPNFREAAQMGREKRKAYGKAHLDKFRKMLLISVIYAVVSFILNLNIGFDIVFISLLIVLTVFSTQR